MNQRRSCSESLFRATSTETIDAIRALNRSRQCSFLIPTKSISAEAAQVGYLLNECLNAGLAPDERTLYRSFFANSRYEAVQGAIKIARHRAAIRRGERSRMVFAHDPSGRLGCFFDPLERGPDAALVPGVRCFSTLDELQAAVAEGPAPAAVIVAAASSPPADEVSELFEKCGENGTVTILDESETRFGCLPALVHEVAPAPGVVVMGEALTNREIPFGVFSMSEDVYRPWNSLETCLLHSSTYSGNRLALTEVRDGLLTNLPPQAGNGNIARECERIGESFPARLEAFARYVNPKLIQFYGFMGYDVDAVEAHGSNLRIQVQGQEETEEVIDFVSGGGAATRGHTPEDLVPEVLDVHEIGRDYFAELSGELTRMSGLAHALPAVSGATAVEIGMTLAMLARGDRTRIVSFTGNYAGKTLLSLVGSEAEIHRKPFGPLYSDVVYIDPSANGAREQLVAELSSGQVALVWFEMIHGSGDGEIPAEFFRLINEYKQSGGYAIGVDEILTGAYRTGKFLSHEGIIASPDVVTLSKALADGTFPVGVALVSESVYRRARERREDVVRRFETLYRNQLGAHIALHCLQKMASGDTPKHVERVSQILKSGIRDVARDSSLLEGIEGEGLLLKILYNYENPLIRALGGLGRELYAMYFCRLWLRRAKVFIFMNRCLPALTMTEQEANVVVQNLKTGFPESRVRHYAGFAAFLARMVASSVRDTVGSALAR